MAVEKQQTKIKTKIIKNFSLRLTTNTFMSSIPNHSLHSLITSDDTVRKIFIKTIFTVNSSDFFYTTELLTRLVIRAQ